VAVSGVEVREQEASSPVASKEEEKSPERKEQDLNQFKKLQMQKFRHAKNQKDRL
jgi:hypothetical protein